MDTIERYRTIIQETLMVYTRIPYAHGKIECKPIFDQDHDSYALITIGWDGKRRVHGMIVHIEIVDGKVWLQRDDTDFAIARELVSAGIPQDQIVLGFHTPEVRPFTGYAVT